MRKRLIFISLLFAILLVACGTEIGFMTSSDDVVVIDVTSMGFEFNGNKVADVRERFGLFDAQTKTAHVHVSGARTFKDLIDVFTPVRLAGFKDVKIALGRDFAHPFTPYLYKKEKDKDYPCAGDKRVFREYHYEKLSAEERYEQRMKDLEKDRKCANDYMELELMVNAKVNPVGLRVKLNEANVIGEYKYYHFENEAELWKFFDELKMRQSLQNRLDYGEIFFAAEETAPLEKLAPYIIHLAQLGYQVKFSTVNIATIYK